MTRQELICGACGSDYGHGDKYCMIIMDTIQKMRLVVEL